MDELDRALRTVSRDLPPRRDLWPDIAAQIAAAATPAPGPERRATHRRWIAAAASVLVVVAAVWIARAPLRPATGAPTTATASALQTLLPPAYLDDRDRLLRTFPDHVATLPPESRAAVEQGLADVHDALEQVGGALQADAASPLLQQLFIDTCQDEMRLLLAVQEAATTHDRGV